MTNSASAGYQCVTFLQCQLPSYIYKLQKQTSRTFLWIFRSDLFFVLLKAYTIAVIRIQSCFNFFVFRSGTKLEKKNWAPSTRNGKVNRTLESMWTTSTSISTVSVLNVLVLHLVSLESYMLSVTSLDVGLWSNHRHLHFFFQSVTKKPNIFGLLAFDW